MTSIKIAGCRVYDRPAHKEGVWVLVDRLWPRGVKKDDFPIDLWLKDIAPSTSLRKWFNHESAKWEEFKRIYLEELKNKSDLLEQILVTAKGSPVTLFYSAKDTQHNNAVVLIEVLQKGVFRGQS
jgi:uncharacterized protein YeaO (DUF488 family)